MSSGEPVCLITGASAGIGAALAREFARHGHALVLVARREDELNKLADAIATTAKKRPQVIVADLATPDGPAQVEREVTARGLAVAILVNNAGYGLMGAAADADRARQLGMIELNARASTDLAFRFLGSITRHKGGILNVASIAGFLPGPGMAVYHATKAYLVSLTEALHEELKEDGVKVCALCPGPVNTGFFSRAGLAREYFPDYLRQSANQVARAGYAGFMSGHRIVVPGRPSRILTLLPRLLPRWLVLRFMQGRWRQAAGG